MRITWTLDWRADVMAYQSNVVGSAYPKEGDAVELAVLIPARPGAFLDNIDAIRPIRDRQIALVEAKVLDPAIESLARQRIPLQPVQPVRLEEVMR